MSGRIPALLAMLDRGQDSALLRFSLGNEYLGDGEYLLAAEHFEQAVRLDENYSAAWKLLGKALEKLNRTADAIDAYEKGIETAEANGDRQAAREMTVFLKRLRKEAGS